MDPRPANLAPGPKSILRNVLRLRMRPLAFWEECVRHGGFAHVPFGKLDVVVLSDPELIEQVLVRDTGAYRKHYGTRILKAIVGEGLLTSEGDFWLRQRRLAQPAFHKKRIDGYANVMVEYARRTIDTWNEGQTLDFHAAMARLTLEIVGKTLFDADVRERADEVGKALDTVLFVLERKLSAPFTIPSWIPTPRNIRFARSAKVLDDLIETILDERRASTIDRGDLLSMLMSARDEETGEPMSRKQLRDEVMTLVLAGHETTANTLVWTFHLLARNPEVYEKLHAELESVLGDRAPSLDDVPKLPYASNVIRESMRLYPAAWGVGRETVRDTDIGPWRVRRGTTILILQWAAHRDESFFPRPLVFEPERWQGDLAKTLPRFAYFPFGGGPRQCIGNTFAILEATLLLATIASRWRLAAEYSTLDAIPAATLRPKGKVPMRLSRW